MPWSPVGATSLEYQVKAAYLYKLVPFVDWPASALPPSGGALNLCIVGNDPFGAALDQMAGNQPGERPLVVRRLTTVTKQSGCHILYIAGSRTQSVASALQSVRGTPSLTITDGAEARDSVIQFVVSGNRVRFTINVEAANQNGLSISSKLLSLALSVRGGPAS